MVSAGLAIYDTMQYIRSPVSTVCIGQAASMGSLLLSRGRQGQALCPAERAHHGAPALRRRAGPGDRYRDPGARDPDLRKRLNEIYVQHTGQPLEAIERKLERDSYMSAEEARDFGLVDEVVDEAPDAGERAK